MKILSKLFLLFFFNNTITLLAQEPTNSVALTVFVHGTHRLQYWISKNPETAGSWMPTQLKPVYDFVFCKPGLHPLSENPTENCYQWVLSQIIKFNPLLAHKKHTYLFCWSGKLSRGARLQEAYNLNTALNNLVSEYKEHFKNITLTVITHSHGGNVVLNLEKIKDPKKYTIDKLILLAIPVQKETSSYVESNLFKTIYSIYSKGDMIQIADPQGWHPIKDQIKKMIETKEYVKIEKKDIPIFSERRFKSAKVKHIEIKNGWRPIGHIEFLLKPFLSILTDILTKSAYHSFSKGDLKVTLKPNSKL